MHKNRIWSFAILAVVICFGLVYITNRTDEPKGAVQQTSQVDKSADQKPANVTDRKEEKEKPKQTAQVTAPTKTPEEQISSAIQNIVDKEDIKILDVSKSNSGYDVVAALKGSESFTKNMTRDGLLMDSTGIFEQIYKTKLVNMVTLTWSLPLSDKYGNDEDTMVMKVKLTKATMDKIKWDNFSYKNLSDVADEFWVSPVLQ